MTKGFTSEQQIRIAEEAQAHANTGRRGLGAKPKGQQPAQAKPQFQGQRKTFDAAPAQTNGSIIVKNDDTDDAKLANAVAFVFFSDKGQKALAQQFLAKTDLTADEARALVEKKLAGAAAPKPVEQKPAKEESDSDDSDSSDSSDSDSDSDSSDDESDSESEDEAPAPKAAAPVVAPAATETKKRAREEESDSDSSDSDSSDSDSDSDDSDSEDEKEEPAAKKQKVEVAQPESDSDSDSDSESDSDSDSDDSNSDSSDDSDSDSDSSDDEDEKKPVAPAPVPAALAPKASKASKPMADEEPKPRQYHRVDPNKVKYLKDELADNSFETLAARGGQFGQRAFNELSKVKGKDFTKAKNKNKKRTVYKGGFIDMHAVNSIKFD